MIVPDTNLLIYAYDESSSHFAGAREWWEDVLSGNRVTGIPWVVVLAFTRLVTHPGICANPMAVEDVRDRVDRWLTFDHVRLLSPTDRTISLFFDLLEGVGTGGNLSTDAMIAALALEHGGCVHSNDADFGRFPDLMVSNPLKEL